MLDLMNNLSSENLVMICFILGTIALILAIIVSIEIYIGNKKYKEELEKSSITDTQTKLNIKEDANIKYVDEIDSELNKITKMHHEDMIENKVIQNDEKYKKIKKRRRREKEVVRYKSCISISSFK